MAKNKDLVLTSVKVHGDIFEEFKVASIKNKFNLQKLLNRSMHLYLNDENFQGIIHSHTALVMSGSL